jgi:hypothetical protein
MAQAPTPGHDRPAAGTSMYRLRVKDTTHLIPVVGMLPIKEKIAVRQATGLPIEAFIRPGSNAFGEDSLVILWWLGRRLAGEPDLTFDAAEAEWPLGLHGTDVDLDFVDPTDVAEASHPE